MTDPLPPVERAQVSAVLHRLQDLLGAGLCGLYLHGSAMMGGLRPHSDLDLLAVIDPDLTDGQRRALLALLMDLSTRHPRAGDIRCLEVMVFATADLAALTGAPRVTFTYGEWLHAAFTQGHIPQPRHDPDAALILAQARGNAQAMVGPAVGDLLPVIASDAIRAAIAGALPDLVADLIGDETNVLLTLARMWRTAACGDFQPKDRAADWAAQQLPPDLAAPMQRAVRAYLTPEPADWSRRGDLCAMLCAELTARVHAAL